MFENKKIKFNLTTLFLWVASSVQNIPDDSTTTITESEFILKVCSLTLKTSSAPPFFHITNLNENFPIGEMITLFHENSIPTILINHKIDMENCITQDRATNIVFLLNDCQEIPSLIPSRVGQKIIRKLFGVSGNAESIELFDE